MRTAGSEELLHPKAKADKAYTHTERERERERERENYFEGLTIFIQGCCSKRNICVWIRGVHNVVVPKHRCLRMP